MRHLLSETLVAAFLTVGGLACSPAQESNKPDSSARQRESAPPTDRLSAADSAAGWRPLLDGTTPTQWRGYKKQSLPGGWQLQGGVLTKDKVAEDLISRDQFGDFELAFDWKLAPGGNAGVFYRGTEDYDHIYWSAPEYQLLDDASHADGRDRHTSAAAAYALYPSPGGIVKPGGEWNSARLVVSGAHVEHWLNGTKMVKYELWSPDWVGKVKASKFTQYPQYGRAQRGYLGIQGDHEGQLQLRNMRIREIKG